MSGGHAIETLSFEVEFATEGQARAQHMRFGDFAAGRGLAVIEEVFDEFAAAGETVRLDQLEVDLGETPVTWSEAEAEERLREALRRALRDAIGPRRQDGAPRPSAADAGAAELDAVWRHLHDGQLPWNLASADRDAFEDLVRRVMARHGAALAERLRSAPAQARLVARLARQWPRGALEALAQRLGAPAAALAVLPPPGAAPEAWERSLAARLGTEPDLAGAGSELALAITVEEAAWPRLINGEPAEVRARLRALARRPGDRARLAAILTDARQRQVLSLWAAAPDVDFLQALLTTPRAWRLGAAMGDAAIVGALRDGLLAYVLAAPGETLDVAAVVEALIRARARVDGLAPARVADALAAGWPGPDGVARARLRAALASRGLGGVLGAKPATDGLATDDAAAEIPASRGWRFDIAPPESAGETPDAELAGEPPWTRRVRLEPAGVADQLRRMGRTAAGRRRLARDLTPARLADVLTLWVEPADATLVAAAVATAKPWRLGGWHAEATLVVLLRQWLLDELLLAPPGPPRAGADLIQALVRRRAAYDDLPMAAVARALAAAWSAEPPDGDAAAAGDILDRLRAILAQLDGGEVVASSAPTATDAMEVGERPTPRRETALHEDPATPSQAADARAALAAAFEARDMAAAVAPLRALLAADRPWLAAEFSRRARERGFVEALADGLPPSLLFALAELRLSEPALRLLLALAGGPGRVPWADVLAAVWSAEGAAPAEVGPDEPLATPTDAPWPGVAPLTAAALARRLRRIAGPAARRELADVLRAAGGYVRDEIGTDFAPASGAASGPGRAPVTLADWRGRLPDRPGAAAVRAISALLVPGLQALADFTEAERRDLLVRLRPADAPGALGAVRLLAAAARTAGLDEPPGDWTAFGWRAVLRELFEEARTFEPAGFTARWFEAWSATVPASAVEPARARLALALETLPLARLLQPARRVGEVAEASKPASDGARSAEDPTPAPSRGSTPRPAPRVGETATSDAPETRAARDTATGADAPGTSAGGTPASGLTEPSAAAEVGRNAPADGASAALTERSADRPQEAAATPSADVEETLSERTEPPSAAQPATRDPSPVAEPSAPAPTAGSPVADGPPTDLSDQGPPAASAEVGSDLALARDLPDPAALAAALRPADAAGTSAADKPAEPEADGAVYVDNAGLVLAGPFIPMLLNRLELTRAGKFVDERSRERAIHLLQFLLDGQDEPAPEHRLTLNKLVCGLDFAIPIGRDFRIEDHERALVESLLRTMIERWASLGRTSIGGLRETFLMRRGVLRPHEDEAWRLTVEPGPYDMLLDRIPWGYGLLKLPWMAQVLHVDWR